jgi:hypothetical protein
MSGNDLQALGDAKLEAPVEVMFLTAAADGDFSDVELDHFLKSVESLTDGRIAHARLEALVTAAAVALDRDGRSARLANVKSAPPGRRLAPRGAVSRDSGDGCRWHNPHQRAGADFGDGRGAGD